MRQAITAKELYESIEALVAQGMHECFRLDYKRDWSDEIVQVVASFANTFGGLVILGVEDNQGRPGAIVGIASSGELKTRISSAIIDPATMVPGLFCSGSLENRQWTEHEPQHK